MPGTRIHCQPIVKLPAGQVIDPSTLTPFLHDSSRKTWGLETAPASLALMCRMEEPSTASESDLPSWRDRVEQDRTAELEWGSMCCLFVIVLGDLSAICGTTDDMTENALGGQQQAGQIAKRHDGLGDRPPQQQR